MVPAPLLLTALLVAAPGAKPVIAVFPIQDSSGNFSPKALVQLGDYFSAKLAASGRYQVVARKDLEAALREKKAESYKQCFDQSCQIEIGKELAAQMVCQLQIVELGDRCGVTATVYDLRTGASDRGAAEKGGCQQNEVVETLEKVAQALTQATAAPVATPVAPPPPVAPPVEPPKPAEPTFTLRISTDPGDAEVLVDGRVVGLGNVQHAIPAGKDATLTVRAPGRITHQSQVNLQQDESQQVVLEWTPDALAQRGEVFTFSLAAFSTLGGTLGGSLWLATPVVRGSNVVWMPLEGFFGFGFGDADLVPYDQSQSGALSPFESGGGVSFGGATRVSYRFDLGERQSLELGLGFGMLFLLGFDDWVDQTAAPVLMPVVRYIALPRGSVGWGVGLRLMVPITGCDPTDPDSSAEGRARCSARNAITLQLEAPFGVY